MLLHALLAVGLGLGPVIERGQGKWVEDLTIGDAEGEALTFLLPAAVRADSHGNVFVLEGKDKVIHEFDAEGSHLLTFSGPGEGPGEMGAVWVMGVDARDRVLIWDHSYKRFTIFDGQGELVGTVPHQPIVQAIEGAANGFVFVQTQAADISERPVRTVIRLVRLSPALDDPVVLDSLRVVETATIAASETSGTTVTLPFVPDLAWAVLPDGGVVLGHTDTNRLAWYDADLQPVRERTLRAKPIETTNEDRERYLRGFGTEDERLLDRIRKQVPFPHQTPVFAALYADEDGTVLASRYDEVEGGVLYEVFSPEGDFLGEMVMPSLDRADLRHGFVYRARRQGDGFPQVVRYRVEPVP